MARKILIADASPTMRKILSSLVQANLSDIQLGEAKNAHEAWECLQQDEYHLLLFSWRSSGEAWLDFFQKLEKHRSARTAAILLTSNSSLPYVQDALDAGVAEALTIPCSRIDLASAINRVCNPITLRRNTRYSFKDTTAVLQQEGRKYHASVINIGKGGLFCELDYLDGFNPFTPVTITVNFQLEERQVVANGLYSVLVRFSVLENDADYSPSRIRLAYRFTLVPPAIQEIFEKAFKLAEERENQISPIGENQGAS